MTIPRPIAIAIAGVVLTVSLAGCGSAPAQAGPAPTPTGAVTERQREWMTTRRALFDKQDAARNSARLDALEQKAREACLASHTFPDVCK